MKWITIFSGAIAVIVVGSVVILALTKSEIPDQLSNWGGIILGFYFGQYMTLAKDYMGLASGTPRPSTALPPTIEKPEPA